jgi:hypothetical protein
MHTYVGTYQFMSTYIHTCIYLTMQANLQSLQSDTLKESRAVANVYRWARRPEQKTRIKTQLLSNQKQVFITMGFRSKYLARVGPPPALAVGSSSAFFLAADQVLKLNKPLAFRSYFLFNEKTPII